MDKLKEICSRRYAARHRADNNNYSCSNPDYKSAKNLNLIIDSPDEDQSLFKKTLKREQEELDETAVKDLNILGDSLYRIENNNYRYIFNLLNKRKLISTGMPGGGRKFIEKSFLYNLFETVFSEIYINVPYMKVGYQAIINKFQILIWSKISEKNTFYKFL